MVNSNCNYALSPVVAASLRVPPIAYPNNVIPGSVISKFTGQKERDTPVDEVAELLNNRFKN